MARLPATASITRTHGLALKAPWVKWRWKPTVMPAALIE